jgi:hypothetical protein
MSRTYRATVRGRFEDLSAAQRERLRDEQDAHTVFTSRFAPEGTFMYTPELVGYQFRYLLHVEEESPEDADLVARMEAEALAESGIRERGMQGRVLDIGLVCVEDMKQRKGKRR